MLFKIGTKIPSDTGSITSETPSEDEIDADEFVMNPTEQDLLENEPDPPVPTGKEVLDYDSEDDLPLSTFIHRWTSNSAHANTPHLFEQTSGPNIPEDAESPTDIFETVERNLGSRVVKDLTRSLKEKKIGTERFKRRQGHEKGDTDWRITKEGILYLKWKDTKSVRFLSNFHNPDDVRTILRKQKDGSSVKFPCLQVGKDYNMYMNYVDKSDMHFATYRIDYLTIVNAYIIFKDRAPNCKIISLKEFRLSVACGFIGADPETAQRGRRSSDLPINKFKVTVPQKLNMIKLHIYPFMGRSFGAHVAVPDQNHIVLDGNAVSARLDFV
ncbi:hypothetical protein NQ314_014461 [Rhamnusium bicolor]|uniref:PiggyBac transposable element-derived protein domain-containing protein n=1 Tax=Rhamnusium bicolor TaxID=1586634 RepID=A0AAV8X2I4_9CUCU|nr:hypothetical protein NQ314_014461 [Rhamnusium bicolor]